MMISLAPSTALHAGYVRRKLPIAAWAMLRVRNEHSQAFRGRYNPENAPWGVEIFESQHWVHVRTVDVVGPPQGGKTFNSCELPTLYDICEGRETVFYMNGSADNALNVWTARWSKTLRADPVLRQQLLDRMEAGRWDERHFADGGVLYSAGPESAVALSQRESRIVRCSELEKTKSAIGDEASSYALARDRAAAYPSTYLITSDCTVTVREGLSWIRFRNGDRSRYFIPCPGCGHYAAPAHPRHLEEPDLQLTRATAHLLMVPQLAENSPSAAEEQAAMTCNACGLIFGDREFRQAMRAGVWVPVGCKVVRSDDVKGTPIPRVRWLDELDRWAAEQLADPDVVDGSKDAAPPPDWSGPRAPDGVTLAIDEATPHANEAALLPALRTNPLKNPNRSFWFWRVMAPKYTLGQVAREIVAGEIGALTGDIEDDRKNTSQKCFVLPYTPRVVSTDDQLNEDAVMLCRSDLLRGDRPANTVKLTCGIDINEDALRGVVRAWTDDGRSYLVLHRTELTGLLDLKAERDSKWREGAAFIATRKQMIYAALDRWWEVICEYGVNLTYVDSGYMSEEIYYWCAGKAFHRLRPCKGLGVNKRDRRPNLGGAWTDQCEKKALECRDATGKPMRHQYFDEEDSRNLMRLDADYWKKEVHSGIRLTAVIRKAEALAAQAKVPLDMGGAAPWWFINAGVERNDPYVEQVVGERWERGIDPRTQQECMKWNDYAKNHFLDAEGYATAAAAALGIVTGQRIAAAPPAPPAPPVSREISEEDDERARGVRRRY